MVVRTRGLCQSKSVGGKLSMETASMEEEDEEEDEGLWLHCFWAKDARLATVKMAKEVDGEVGTGFRFSGWRLVPGGGGGTSCDLVLDWSGLVPVCLLNGAALLAATCFVPTWRGVARGEKNGAILWRWRRGGGGGHGGRIGPSVRGWWFRATAGCGCCYSTLNVALGPGPLSACYVCVCCSLSLCVSLSSFVPPV
jgi:hypothetical protein